MTKIVLDYKDYDRVLKEGKSLESYLLGRFVEAASDVKYLNDEQPPVLNLNDTSEEFKGWWKFK